MATLANSDELLLAYATGALAEAPALLVATHLTLNPERRRQLRAFEAVGGALLDDIEPVALSGAAKAALLARLDSAEAPAAPRPAGDPRLPAPLAALLPDRLERLPWRRRLRGLKDWDLPPLAGGKARLLWVAGHTAIPRHSHQGLELTLVLQGAYQDSGQTYAAGDLQLADGTVDHKPTVTAAEPCLCLVVTDAPVRLTGRFGRLLNRFVRY